MNPMDQFKQTYFTECSELLEDMQERLLHLEETPPAQMAEQLNAIFRCAHSIKGGAGAFGFDRLVQFTHALEYVLDALREDKLTATADVVDVLLQCVDVVQNLVHEVKAGQTPNPQEGKALEETLLALLQAPAGASSAAPKSEPAPSQSSETKHYQIQFTPVRDIFITGNEPLLLLKELAGLGIATVTCDTGAMPSLEALETEHCYLRWTIQLQTEKPESAIREVFEFVEDQCELTITPLEGVVAEVVPNKNDAPEKIEAPEPVAKQAADNSSPAPSHHAAASVTSIRVDIEKVDTLVNMVGELVITQAMLMQQTKHLPVDQFPGVMKGIEELSRHTRELQEAVMAVRMQPIKTIFSRMPRLVRDLAKQLNKQVNITMIGEGTEIDKTVIEQLGDPLTHMIRNSLDHGLETPEERIAAGKDPEGTITLSADHSGGRIIILVEDDGRGINRDRVLKKAREKGLVAADAQLGDEQIDQLVFLPGFSTADAVTNVSGRGVGMDVVRRNIHDMGGTVELTNTPGKGTQFLISLPLTLAILDGMIVRVEQEDYVIPINNIIETLHPKSGQLQPMADGQTVMNVRGVFVPIMELENAFSIPRQMKKPESTLVVLVETGRHTFGIAVDEIIGQQQVVIKNIEENSDPIEGVSGATILGDGNIALILDIAKLFQMRNHAMSKTPLKQAA